jgi:phenylalanyl-tRNA synthetase beta chain
MKTPDLRPERMSLELDYANKLLGTNFSQKEVKSLLEKMRYGVKLDGKRIEVLIPAYRTDVLHPIDLVEDVAIAYGYDKFEPEIPKISTIGEMDGFERFSSSLRELMLGFGFQEVMTLIMTNQRDLFERMAIKKEKTVVANNPVSLEHSTARNWLLPSLMTVLERNKNREYPQKVFEIGECITARGADRRNLAGVMAHSKANFSEMKAIFTGLLENLGLKYTINGFDHGSFIGRRCASTEYGFFGEIHPRVLENFNLETPVTAFELDLNLIFKGI